MTQSFCLLNMEKNCTLLARGEETTTPLGHQILVSQEYMYIKKSHNFPLISLWSANFNQLHEMTQKFVSTPLFNFQDLKLSTMNIILILKDTLNTTLGPLLISDPHATKVPSKTLERHSIGSRVAYGIYNLVISFTMAKLVSSPTSDLHSHMKSELRTSHLWICYLTKVLWITIFSTKFLIHFQRWCLVRELPSPPKLPLSTILS
jgi:hypothetical protein